MTEDLPPEYAGGDSKPPDAAETIDDRINILVMGLDQRLDQPDDDAYRTDSVVIFTIDPYSKTAGALSIPRDTRVEIPDGHGGVYMSTRINEAYEMGEYGINGFPSEDYKGGGPQLAMDTIKHNFGIPIDYYVILNWANFIQIVDELGGIDVDVPEYVYDPAYATCQFCSDYYAVEFVPGQEHMDGTRALEYARLRKSDNDYKRIERQQIVMRAIAAKATSLNLLDVGKAKDLYGTYKDSIQTNIPDLQIPGLATLASQVGLSNVKMVSAADATYPCPAYICGNAAELSWDPQKMQEIIAEVFSDQRIVNENATVQILNGTNTPNLAQGIKGQLTIRGIPAESITKDEYANGLLWDNTVVIDMKGTTPQTINQIKQALDLSDSDVVTPGEVPTYYPDLEQFLNSTADIVIVLGADTEPPVSGGPYEPQDPVYYTPEPTLEPEPEPTFEPAPEEPTPEPIITEEPAPTDEPLPTDTPPAEAETGG